MTHEQILKNVKTMLETAYGLADESVIEYLDGAIGELILEERAASRASFAEEIVHASNEIRR